MGERLHGLAQHADTDTAAHPRFSVPCAQEAAGRAGHLPFRPRQYNPNVFRTELAKRNFQQSTAAAGVGNCYDNAPMELFWARMKTELGHPLLFDDLRDARSIVYRWMHLYYNR